MVDVAGTALLVLVGAGTGCTRVAHPLAQASSNSPVVALVSGVPISGNQLTIQMRRTGGDRRHALDDLVTFEVLASAAGANGLAAPVDPDDLQKLRAVKVQRLVEAEIEPRLTREAVAETDIRALYERVKPRFVHGRLVEVAVLAIFTGARMRPEPRSRAENNAHQLRALLSTPASRTAAAFEALAKEAAWIERKVTFTTTWQGQDQPFPAVVGKAVQALSRAGELTDVVGDETGYYIALYLSEKPPANISFAEASPTLREEMYEPWRRQRFLQLALTLAQGHDIEVFPENFPALTEAPPTTP